MFGDDLRVPTPEIYEVILRKLSSYFDLDFANATSKLQTKITTILNATMESSQLSAFWDDACKVAIYDANSGRYASSRINSLLKQVLPLGLETKIDNLKSGDSAEHETDTGFEVEAINAMRRQLSIANRPWENDAMCISADPECFFPEKGGSAKPAYKICQRCSVTDECLQYALANDERFGVWGGKSERQRHRLLKQNATS